MKSQKKDSEKSFLAKLRKRLGIMTAWKMARCLELPFTTYYSAELKGGLPPKRMIQLLSDKFGSAIVCEAIKDELDGN